MASNFKIQCKSKNNALHVRLRGDFDGTSADQLNMVLHKRGKGREKIYVNTDQLRQVNEFGLSIFESHLTRVKNSVAEVIITGKNKGILMRAGR